MKCIQCGKETNNPSWCGEECVDIWEGNTPRRPEGFCYDGRIRPDLELPEDPEERGRSLCGKSN